jgi:hypothetical protein
MPRMQALSLLQTGRFPKPIRNPYAQRFVLVTRITSFFNDIG